MPNAENKINRIGIMQPYFVPYLGYWQLMNKVNNWIIFDDVQFIDKGWINRNKIIHPENSDKTIWVTIPLESRKQFSLIKDIQIDNSKNWKETINGKFTHLKNKTKFYQEGKNLLNEILNHKTNWLIEFLVNSISIVKKIFKIHCKIKIQSKNFSSINSNNNFLAGEWALQLTKLANGSHYINPIGGKHLFCNNLYKKNNITLEFFEPNLNLKNNLGHSLMLENSILEIVSRYGLDKVSKFLNEGEIIEANYV